MNEQWQESYEKEVEIYDTFSKHEDAKGKLLKSLLKRTSFANKTVLEVGCGSGKYTKLISPRCSKYYALDKSKPLVDIAKQKCKKLKNIKFFNCSAEKIPLEDNSVDIVFASWVLTAMTSDKMREKSITEILRVLKGGGEIWLFENHWEGEFIKLRGLETRKIEKAGVYPLMHKYGFELIELIDTNFSFPSLNEARRILGFMFGDKAQKYLKKNPTKKLKHKVIILHRKKELKIKVLHQWPLSKVEVVEVGGKKFILKTIHKDFVDEVKRQELLRKKCKLIKIPEIYWIKEGKKVVSFLMEYIPHEPGRISQKVSLDIIGKFHKDTRDTRSKFLKKYDFEEFYKDFGNVKQYLNSNLMEKSKKELQDFFRIVFASPISIVHGDWGNDQLLGKKNRYYVVDFGKSFRGPSILDKTKFIKSDTDFNVKAKILRLIKGLAWLDLCKRNYIDYSYKKEIKAKVDEIKQLEKNLKQFPTLQNTSIPPK
jgi:ubiquinone/menaquinone biosynthesis C-methylase UbiE